jgi:hypothetical protein
MGVSTKVTLDDVLGEVIPALLAAGLSEAQLRAISADARRGTNAGLDHGAGACGRAVRAARSDGVHAGDG